MAVAVANAFTVGQHIPRVLFRFPAAASSVQSVEVSAEMVWLSESKKGAGLQFVGLSADARDRIASWIARERTAPESAHLPKPIRRDRQPLQINSARSRTIFSRVAIGDEEAGARYATMFPSENANPRITATLDEIKTDDEPQPSKPAAGNLEEIPGSLAQVSKVSMAGDAPIFTATSAKEGNRRSAAAPIQDTNRDGREPLRPDKPEMQPSTTQIEVPPSGADGSSENINPPEKSAEKGFKLQFAIFGFLLVAISFILGLTAGYAPIEKRLRSFGRPKRPPAIAPSASSAMSQATSPAPSSTTFDATLTQAPSDKEEEPEIPPVPPHSRSSNSVADATPPAVFQPPARNTRLKNDSDNSLKTHELQNAPPPESSSKKSTAPAATTAPARSKKLNPSPTIGSKEPKPTAKPETEPEEHSDSTSPAGESAARTAPPKAEPEAAPVATGSAPEAPSGHTAPSATPPALTTPAPRPARRPAPAPANVVIPPAENGKLVRAILPRKSIADSPELGITSQLSVLIPSAERVAIGDHETARLQAGGVITYVVPHQPKPGRGYNSTETVRVRATIGSDGRVTDVKPLNGPIFLLASVVSAVRQWRFHPTLLNGRPAQAQDDVTIEFRLQR